jgi:hypothetical protein
VINFKVPLGKSAETAGSWLKGNALRRRWAYQEVGDMPVWSLQLVVRLADSQSAHSGSNPLGTILRRRGSLWLSRLSYKQVILGSTPRAPIWIPYIPEQGCSPESLKTVSPHGRPARLLLRRGFSGRYYGKRIFYILF